MAKIQSNYSVAIACGGTGGHLFPGRAVADELLARRCRVTLLISPKEVDQEAARHVAGMEVVTLPAVGLSWSRLGAFLGARGSPGWFHTGCSSKTGPRRCWRWADSPAHRRFWRDVGSEP